MSGRGRKPGGSRDRTPLQVRCSQWPQCMVPAGMHEDVLAGVLNKEQVYTYYVMRLWGRKNGHVWRNRDELAKEVGLQSRKPLKAHHKALVDTGWIDRHYQKSDLEHSYPRYVLTLRDTKRTEDTCQCWFKSKCRCGKVQVRPTGISMTPPSEGVGSSRAPQGGVINDPPKKEYIKVDVFRENEARVSEVNGREGGDKAGDGTRVDEETRDETEQEPEQNPTAIRAPLGRESDVVEHPSRPERERDKEQRDNRREREGGGSPRADGRVPERGGCRADPCRGEIGQESKQDPGQDGTKEDFHAIPAEPEPEPFHPPEANIADTSWGDTNRHGDVPKPAKKQRKRGSRRGMAAIHGTPQWPPRSGDQEHHAGYDVACRWIEEMRERHPGYKLPVPGGPDVGTAASIYQRVDDPDAMVAILRLAVWDWAAIQETIEPWYTKTRPEPEPQAILKILPHLANKLESGVVSPGRRVSAYKQRWITDTWQDPTAPDVGESLAEKFRREQREKRERAG